MVPRRVISMKSRWVGQAIAKFTADAVAHALHGGPTVDGLLSERLVYRLFRKVEVQHFGQQRETVDFLGGGVD
jgi:hypothetical protein